jgi:hypothetical protein
VNLRPPASKAPSPTPSGVKRGSGLTKPTPSLKRTTTSATQPMMKQGRGVRSQAKELSIQRSSPSANREGSYLDQFRCELCHTFTASTFGDIKHHQMTDHVDQFSRVRLSSRRSVSKISAPPALKRGHASRPAASSRSSFSPAQATVEGSAPSRSEAPLSKPNGQRLSACQVCRVQVRKDRLDRHISRVHRDQKQSMPRRSTPKPPKDISAARLGIYVQSPPPKTLLCPSCRERILESSFVVHQWRCSRAARMSPRSQGNRRHSRVVPGEGGSESSSRMHAGDEIRGQGRRRSIDASPDGRLPRDHGRFGSFPSHDGYGDEDGA